MRALGFPDVRESSVGWMVLMTIANLATNPSADTDLRLCKFFGLSEGYFLRLQNAYDTLEAKRRLSGEIAKIKPYRPRKAA